MEAIFQLPAHAFSLTIGLRMVTSGDGVGVTQG